MKKLNKNTKFIVYIIISVLLIQILATSLTNTKKFSIQAFLRNLVWAYAFYQIYHTKNILWLFVPIIFNVLFNVIFNYIVHLLKIRIQPYITTKYLYNDYFEYFVNKNPTLCYYTEGTYRKLLNFDVLDLSKENTDIIMNWGKQQYENSFENKPIVDFNNNEINSNEIMKQSQIQKFEWIIDNLNITNNSRVLEIGFGKLDLMNYIRDNTGAEIVGTNISQEQIDHAHENNYEAYNIDFINIGKHLDKLGKFDIIITNGSLEYLKNDRDNKTFSDFINTINKLLNSGGRWYTTTLHHTKNMCINEFFNKNYYNFYNLLFGNEGSYPRYPDGLTKYAKENNLNVIKQETRWLDYYIFSILWMIAHKTILNENRNILKHLNAYIAAPNYLESYLCYTPFKNMYYFQPWLWQFIKQKNECVPTYHQWIIFQKN